MRSNFERPTSRVAMLACGLALYAVACGGNSGGGTGGQGGAKADAGGDTIPGQGGARTDGGAGAGGKTTDAGDSGGQGDGRTDGTAGAGDAMIGTGGQGDAATDGGAGGAGGTLSLPWHAFLPLGAAAAGSTAAMGTTLDLTANHYDATYYGTTISFTNAALALTAGATPELVVIPTKSGGPAVDVTGSYSVSVWATLANIGGFRTIVSSEGFNIASFFLQMRADTNAFAFTVSSADSIAAPGCVVPNRDPVPDGGTTPTLITPVANTEYHLVATRDGATGMSILYVNGVESGRALCAGGWADTGIVGVGHGIFNASRGDFVNGSLAELGLINRVLTPTEVADLFARGRTGIVRPDAGPDTGPADAGPPDAASDTPAGTDAPAADAPGDTPAGG
jgi:hypothetical protein